MQLQGATKLELATHEQCRFIETLGASPELTTLVIVMGDAGQELQRLRLLLTRYEVACGNIELAENLEAELKETQLKLLAERRVVTKE